MSIKLIAAMGLVASVFLAGCSEDKKDSVQAFVGHWVEVNSADAKPMTLDIEYDGAAVLVDEKKTVFGKDFESKVVGKAGADNTVTFEQGVGKLSMTLMNDRLLYKGRELVKSP